MTTFNEISHFIITIQNIRNHLVFSLFPGNVVSADMACRQDIFVLTWYFYYTEIEKLLKIGPYIEQIKKFCRIKYKTTIILGNYVDMSPIFPIANKFYLVSE